MSVNRKVTSPDDPLAMISVIDQPTIRGRSSRVRPATGALAATIEPVKEVSDKLWPAEFDLAPAPDSGPGEDLEPAEETPDPRAAQKRRRRAAGAAGPDDEAPHFADWFSSRGSLAVAPRAERDKPADAAQRDKLAEEIVSRLNPEQA